MSSSGTGKSVPRRDLRPKLTGEAKYTADLKLPGLLYAAVLRSPHPHADILSVDATKARGLPGVHAIVTPFDAPEGMVDTDLPILDTRVRFVGDEVAAVAAEDPEMAGEAAAMLEVEYRTLPFVLEAEAALNAVLGTIQSALLSGDRVVLTGFGSFEVRNVKARRVRPIRSNGSEDLITVPAHKRVGFTPGAELSKSAKV